MRVLLAEDSLVNQRLACGLLERKGHTVTIATTGREAVELFQSQPFDLILMDVQMPELDGLAASQAIRNLEATDHQRVPIIAMTGNEAEGDRQRCLHAGMDDYIAKPIRANELFEKIERLTSAHGHVKEQAPEQSSIAETPQASRVDWDAALRALGGKHDLMRELVDLYCQEAPRLLQQAQQAIEGGDAESLRIAAHTLKGSSRYFGPTDVGELAADLEQLATKGDFVAAQHCSQQLERAVDELIPVLKQFGQQSTPPPT